MWHRFVPLSSLLSPPFLPSPYYHLSFLLPWYCLCVFLFSTYVFYFSPWRNTHTSYPRSPKLLFPRADGIISMQIHTGHTLVWISSRDESRSSRESRKSNDISWIPFETYINHYKSSFNCSAIRDIWRCPDCLDNFGKVTEKWIIVFIPRLIPMVINIWKVKKDGR